MAVAPAENQVLNSMDKKALTEADIRTKFITPALLGPDGSKWNVMTQLREEIYFTKGRVIVRGKTVKRGEAKKADYILYLKPGVPIAVSSKDNTHTVGAGMQQALEYAEFLDLPFAFSSNGDAFLEHDRTGVSRHHRTRDSRSTNSPRPTICGRALSRARGYTAAQEAVTTQGYHDDGSGKAPRYYQLGCHQPHDRGDREGRKPHPAW